jgi:hypothetical protein
VQQVFGLIVQKLLNINFIIENLMKSKNKIKIGGNWAMILILLENPQISIEDIKS